MVLLYSPFMTCWSILQVSHPACPSERLQQLKLTETNRLMRVTITSSYTCFFLFEFFVIHFLHTLDMVEVRGDDL